MNQTFRRSFALIALSITGTLGSVGPLQAAVDKQPKYELAFGVPQFPLDAQKKPKKAEILFNLNVPDPANANAMKSFPVLVTLDPANFPAYPAVPNAANVAKWELDMKKAKNKAIAEAISADEQIKDNNKALKAAGRPGDRTFIVYEEKGDINTFDKAGKKVKVGEGPHIKFSNLRYDLGDATAALRCPVFRTKDETKEPGSAAPARVPGQPPTPTPTPSPGKMGGKGKSSMGYQWESTPGNLIPSDVSFGYFDNVDGGPALVATVYPLPGQTDAEILMELADELMGMGVPVTYDSLNNLLTLNVDIGPNQTFWFDDTDPGLDFDIYMPAFGAYGAAVPEPSTVVLLTVLGTSGLIRRRRLAK